MKTQPVGTTGLEHWQQDMNSRTKGNIFCYTIFEKTKCITDTSDVDDCWRTIGGILASLLDGGLDGFDAI